VDGVTAPTESRAVLRQIEPGFRVVCPRCAELVKFQAQKRLKKVVANVYEDGRWVRTEHWHSECYVSAGEPYGPPDETAVRQLR
jgi:hypothetical protein